MWWKSAMRRYFRFPKISSGIPCGVITMPVIRKHYCAAKCLCLVLTFATRCSARLDKSFQQAGVVRGPFLAGEAKANANEYNKAVQKLK